MSTEIDDAQTIEFNSGERAVPCRSRFVTTVQEIRTIVFQGPI